MIGVGGVVIDAGRTLLIRRGSHPLKGEWSIPGGLLEVGERRLILLLARLGGAPIIEAGAENLAKLLLADLQLRGLCSG